MIPTPPLHDAFIDNAGRLTRSGMEWINLLWLAANSETESGTTAQRPSKNLWIGRRYFDTTLGMPIFISAVTPSVTWVDSTGSTV